MQSRRIQNEVPYYGMVERGCEHNAMELVNGVTKIVPSISHVKNIYDNLVTMLKRPGFRRLDLDLFTCISEISNWTSFRNSLTRKALSEAKDLRHITIYVRIDIINSIIVYPLFEARPRALYQKAHLV